MGQVQQGMDVERVRSIAQSVMALGDQMTTVAQTGRGQMQVLVPAWGGPDAEYFGGQWEGLEGTIHQAADDLRSAGKLMLLNADEQEQASAAGGGVSPGSATSAGKGWFETLKSIFTGDIKTAFNLIKKGYGAATGLFGLSRYLQGSGTWLQNFKLLSKYMGADEAIKALGRIGPMTLAEAKAAKLAGWTTKLGALSPLLRTVGNLAGKVAGPLGVVMGGMDLYNGIKDGDWLTAVKGGAGVVSGGAATALAFGGAALAGTAAAPFVVGAAVIGGAVWAGIEIYQNREAIWNGIKQAGGFIADGAKGIVKGAGSVLSGIGRGLGSVFG